MLLHMNTPTLQGRAIFKFMSLSILRKIAEYLATMTDITMAQNISGVGGLPFIRVEYGKCHRISFFHSRVTMRSSGPPL